MDDDKTATAPAVGAEWPVEVRTIKLHMTCPRCRGDLVTEIGIDEVGAFRRWRQGFD